MGIWISQSLWFKIAQHTHTLLILKWYVNVTTVIFVIRKFDVPCHYKNNSMHDLGDWDRFRGGGGVLSQCTRARAKQEVESEGFDVLFAQARVPWDNKPRQIGLNYDYNMTFSISPVNVSNIYVKGAFVLEERAVSHTPPIVTSRSAHYRGELSPHNTRQGMLGSWGAASRL